MLRLSFLFLVSLICLCATSSPNNKKGVQNLHMICTSSPDEMVLSWLTDDETSTSMCWYGINNVDDKETGYQDFYNKGAGYNHNVKLTNLVPNSTYSYQCGDDTDGISEIYHFTTRPLLPPNTQHAMTYGIYGDMGVHFSNDTITSIKRVVDSGRWELIWHLGDISYANDAALYESTWNSWFRSMADPMAQIPYMTSPGNHEKWSRDPVTNSNSGNFSAYEHKFRMPGNESGAPTNLFFSYDYGLVHFISLNTEDGYAGSPIDPEPMSNLTQNPTPFHPHLAVPAQKEFLQMNWLQDDLKKAAANRVNVPWIVVGGHRPIYSANEQRNDHPTGTSKNIQEWLEPLFIEYGVDFYFSGHDHNYQRMWPVVNNELQSQSYEDIDATVYVLHGNAGNIEGHQGIGKNIPDWFAAGNGDDYGYGQLQVWNSTHATWTAFVAGTDAVMDTMTVSKKR